MIIGNIQSLIDEISRHNNFTLSVFFKSSSQLLSLREDNLVCDYIINFQPKLDELQLVVATIKTNNVIGAIVFDGILLDEFKCGALADIIAIPNKITAFSLANAAIDDIGLTLLSHAIASNEHLYLVGLEGNNFSQSSMKHLLNALTSNPYIADICLSKNKINDAGFYDILECMASLTRLDGVDLTDNLITGQSLHSSISKLLAMPSTPSPLTMGLFDNPISQEGLKNLYKFTKQQMEQMHPVNMVLEINDASMGTKYDFIDSTREVLKKIIDLAGVSITPLPVIKKQLGPNCGYYAVECTTKSIFKNFQHDKTRQKLPLTKVLKQKSLQALSDYKKEHGAMDFGDIFSVYTIAKLIEANSCQSFILDATTFECFKFIIQTALLHNYPLIIPYNQQDDLNNEQSFIEADKAHWGVIIGWYKEGNNDKLLMANSGNRQSVDANVLYQQYIKVGLFYKERTFFKRYDKWLPATPSDMNTDAITHTIPTTSLEYFRRKLIVVTPNEKEYSDLIYGCQFKK